MAKKNIISDFASLKGKISFSEPETVLRKGQIKEDTGTCRKIVKNIIRNLVG